MAVCWVELYFLQNMLVDAGLLYLASCWRGVAAKPCRVALGAALGGVWAVLARAQGGALCTLPAQAVSSIGMLWTACGPMPRREAAAALSALWLCAITAGGAAALGLSPVLAGVAAGMGGMAALRRKNAPPPPRVQVSVTFAGQTHACSAIVDTGNRALDPLTGLPVLFVPDTLPGAPQGHPLCVRTASGARQLRCFIPDSAQIDGTAVRLAVALAPAHLLPHALAPWSVCASAGKEAIAG